MKPADNAFELYRLGATLRGLLKKIDDKPNKAMTWNDIFFELSSATPLLNTLIENKFIPLRYMQRERAEIACRDKQPHK